MKKSWGGFTLVELLVVVGIISVLTATAIPLFSGSEERSGASVCASNCRNMKTELDLDILLDGSDPTTVFSQVKEGYTCPSGGEYILDYDRFSGSVSVWCTAHSKNASMSPDSLNKIYDEVKNGDTGISVRDNLDSECAKMTNDCVSKQLIDAMSALGVDLSNTLWRINGSGNTLASILWTTADPDTLKPGDTVYAIKFNFPGYSKDWRGCYSVYTCTVSEHNNEGLIYNVLDTKTNEAGKKMTELTASKDMDVTDKKDFSTMMDIYNAAVAANGGSPVIHGS